MKKPVEHEGCLLERRRKTNDTVSVNAGLYIGGRRIRWLGVDPLYRPIRCEIRDVIRAGKYEKGFDWLGTRIRF